MTVVGMQADSLVEEDGKVNHKADVRRKDGWRGMERVNKISGSKRGGRKMIVMIGECENGKRKEFVTSRAAHKAGGALKKEKWQY